VKFCRFIELVLEEMIMIGKYSWVIVLACLMMFTVNAWADEAAMKKEMDGLNERVEQLEKKLEQAEKSRAGGWSALEDRITLKGVMAGAYQLQSVSGPSEAEDTGRGALPFQPEVSVKLTENDQFFFKFGFAAGNGLNPVNPFLLAPWAADLEDDVKDINGRNRDYLLTAWYKHTFKFSEEQSLALSGGLIDATDYLDENAYANDEYTQFMNEALVNGPNAFAPSYDIGGAVEWAYSQFSVNGVVMGIGENDDGNAYNFYGLQLGYALETPLGEGNYRFIFQKCSEAYQDPTETSKEGKQCVLFSFDQALGDMIGAWVRFGKQDDDAKIPFQNLYSGGIDIKGSLWGREQDNIGIGYGYLDGGNQGVDRTQVTEAYVRFALNEFFALTLDVQYLEDTYKSGAGEDVDGWITGIRMTAEF